MADYIIVDKDKSPLEPGEIPADGTIFVNDGDTFIIDPDVSNSVKFETGGSSSVSFEIIISESNSNDFDIDIHENLSPTITIADGTQIPDVDIKGHEADSIVLNAGDDVSLGKYEGSKTGSDTLTIGNNFQTDHDIKTEGGDDAVTIGDNASIRDIDLGDGDDALTVGDDLDAEDIKSGDGNDNIFLGDDASIEDIDTGKGDDDVSIGDGLVADDIKTEEGDDNITIGDGAQVDDLNTGKGDDNVSLGDDVTIDKVETKEGDDFVSIGTNAVIDKLDGGKDNDALDSDTPFPDAANFENIICFADDTRILTDRGEVPVEMLVAGDRVVTRDHGLQRIRWIGGSFHKGAGALAPVLIKKGALGNKRNLWVSQQHRILINDWRAELYFGQPEVFVAAKHLVDGKNIKIVEKTWIGYFHVLMDRHEVVVSEGILTESFFPGDVGISTLSDKSRREIDREFPNLLAHPKAYGPTARISLRAFEARLIVEDVLADYRKPVLDRDSAKTVWRRRQQASASVVSKLAS